MSRDHNQLCGKRSLYLVYMGANYPASKMQYHPCSPLAPLNFQVGYEGKLGLNRADLFLIGVIIELTYK